MEEPPLESLQHEGALLMSGVPFRFVLACHLLEVEFIPKWLCLAFLYCA